MAHKKQILFLLLTVLTNLIINTVDVKADTIDLETQRKRQVKESNPLVGTKIDPQTITRMLTSTVVFHWDRGKTFGSPHESLGTKIDIHTVLTHNHFGDLIGTHIIDLSYPDRPHGVSSKTKTSAFGDSSGFGKQTRLVTSPVRFEGPFPPIASRQTINNLGAGDRVEVVYWDDHRQEIAVVTLAIQNVLEGSVIELSDPADIINKGDSGGGVFFQGELIGNTWRIIRWSNQYGDITTKVVQIHLAPEAVKNWVTRDLEP